MCYLLHLSNVKVDDTVDYHFLSISSKVGGDQ